MQITEHRNGKRMDRTDTRELGTCEGCAEAYAVSQARKTLAAAHPDWTLMRVHDRALILAMKTRNSTPSV